MSVKSCVFLKVCENYGRLLSWQTHIVIHSKLRPETATKKRSNYWNTNMCVKHSHGSFLSKLKMPFHMKPFIVMAAVNIEYFFLSEVYLFVLYVSICLHVCMYTMYMRLSHTRRELLVRSITDCCKLSCGCWTLNLGPLQEHKMTLYAEPSL